MKFKFLTLKKPVERLAFLLERLFNKLILDFNLFFLSTCQDKYYVYLIFKVFMKTLTVGKLKTPFLEVLPEVQNGEEVAIAFGKKKEIVAYLVKNPVNKLVKRKLGIAEHKGKVIFKDDYKMTEAEFLGL